ncbi:MAG: spore cortex-lytic enzyme [Peptococcaceae bacterium]|nr:spore cortex-lytic enzyme [Peptococcaceae bacterium]
MRIALRWILITVIFAAVAVLSVKVDTALAERALYWGSRGQDVRQVQQRLSWWGYYDGPVDGIYGPKTWAAVKKFQRKNGLRADGIVGDRTWAALGLARKRAPIFTRPAAATAFAAQRANVHLLARAIEAEAANEPLVGKVAVGAVILNRIQSPRFPNTLSGVIFQPLAFESVMNGLIWRRSPSPESARAAQLALAGWDPTHDALYFWNPAKSTSWWIWTRRIYTQIGRHVFGR